MQKKYILISILFFCQINADAQSLNKLMSDAKNFKDIETKLKKNEKILENASQKEQKYYNRWKWFWNTRVDSSGSFERYNTEMNNYLNKIYPTGHVDNVSLKSASLSWTCLGPNSRPVGTRREIGRGRIRPIWVNPDKTNSILIGSNSGGLWKTTNGGDNWTCLTNNLMTGGVFDIAVNPNDTNIIYIATGTRLTPNGDLGMSNNYSLGIFKSIDGGSSWTKLNIATSTGEHFRGIVIKRADTSILYALSSDKVYKSTDSGSSWTTTPLTISTGQLLTDIIFKPNDPNTIYVSGYQNAIYKSTDAGANWINLAPNMLSLFANSRIAIATNPEVSNELYAFYCNVDEPSQDNIIEKSIDGGNTWDTIITEYLTGVHYAIVLKLSPEGDIYAGGINLWKSTDGGNTFPDVLRSSNIHVDFMDIEFPDPNDNDLIYVTTDGGVYMDD